MKVTSIYILSPDVLNMHFLQKRVLSGKERAEAERRRKKKEMQQIEKEMKQRQMRRLWDAQSIQRKINEVEVRQADLDERAKKLERQLRRPYRKFKS